MPRKESRRDSGKQAGKNRQEQQHSSRNTGVDYPMSIHPVASTSSVSNRSRTAIPSRDPQQRGHLHQEGRRTSKRRRLHTSYRAVKSCPASPEMSPESCSSQESCNCAWEKVGVYSKAWQRQRVTDCLLTPTIATRQCSSYTYRVLSRWDGSSVSTATAC